MSQRLLIVMLLFSACLPSLGLAQGGMSSVPAIAAQIQVMQINDVLRTKVRHADELKASGIDGAKPGDAVEFEKRADGSVGVKHLPSGQCGVLAPAK